MFRNYFKIALRTIFKHKLFSFINIFGLGLSLSFCLLVIIIINDQNSFDRFHPQEEDVYRVLTVAHRKDGGTEKYASSPRPVGDVLANESAAVEKVVQLTGGLSGDASYGQTTIRLSGFFTDRTFFEVFGFHLASGDPQTALDSPNTLVLTPETAANFFGETDPIGKTVTLKRLGDFVITGVLQPKPGKTHLEFDALASSASLAALEKENKIRPVLEDRKNYYASYNYLRLHADQKSQVLQPLLSDISKRFYGDLELESRDQGYSFELQPLTKITPGPILSNNLGRAMPDTMLIFLGILALIGMVAAVFNYISLTLARSLTRAKEVGIRKVTGAVRSQVFLQFLGESILSVTLALLVAGVLLQLLLIPGFKQLQIAASLDLDFFVDNSVLTAFIGFAFLIGLVAGLLPAAAISGFRPAQILSDISKIKVFSKLTLRKALIVFQFALSLILIIVATTVYKQIDYALRKVYGFTWENILNIDLQGNDFEIVAQEMAQHSEVVSFSASSHNMGTWEDSSVDVRISATDEPVGIRDYSIDAHFVENFNLELVAGENFNADRGAGNENFALVNERFLERFQLGTPHEAIGKTFIVGDSTQAQIAGVLKDFLFKPLVYDLEPMFLRYAPDEWNVLNLKIHGANIAGVLAHLEKTWKTIDSVHPLSYQFYDDLIQQVYSYFQDMMFIVGFLAALALTISLLGLLGIATFNAESRIKEIGIRKVMGANLRQLMVLLSRQDAVLLGIAAIVAVPLSLWLASMLLQTFAYRIDLGVSVLLPGVMAIFLLAGLTIGWQALKAALANPVEALRYE